MNPTAQLHIDKAQHNPQWPTPGFQISQLQPKIITQGDSYLQQSCVTAVWHNRRWAFSSRLSFLGSSLIRLHSYSLGKWGEIRFPLQGRSFSVFIGTWRTLQMFLFVMQRAGMASSASTSQILDLCTAGIWEERDFAWQQSFMYLHIYKQDWP